MAAHEHDERHEHDQQRGPARAEVVAAGIAVVAGRSPRRGLCLHRHARIPGEPGAETLCQAEPRGGIEPGLQDHRGGGSIDHPPPLRALHAGFPQRHAPPRRWTSRSSCSSTGTRQIAAQRRRRTPPPAGPWLPDAARHRPRVPHDHEGGAVLGDEGGDRLQLARRLAHVDRADGNREPPIGVGDGDADPRVARGRGRARARRWAAARSSPGS